MLVVESSRKIIVHNRPQYSAEESDTFPKAWSFGVSEAKEASRNLKALDLSTKKKKKKASIIRTQDYTSLRGSCWLLCARQLSTLNK